MTTETVRTRKIFSNSNKNRQYKRSWQVQKPGKKFGPKTAFLDTLRLDSAELLIITAYEPDAKVWKSDWKTRKKR